MNGFKPRPSRTKIPRYVTAVVCVVVELGRQLTTFNHQGLIMIGGKADVNGRPVEAYQGTVAG